MLQPTFCLLKTVDSLISSPGISAEPTKVAGGTAASGLHAPEERHFGSISGGQIHRFHPER